jgi:hypothetical protein
MTTTSRRELMQAAGLVALNTALAVNQSGTAHAEPKDSEFNIDEVFLGFMRDLGGSPADGGGTVTFTGRDPILRSQLRIATSMAIPAMAAGVGAAAIWKKRTGEGQDLKVDLRESIYNVNPVIGLILRYKQSHDAFPGIQRACATRDPYSHLLLLRRRGDRWQHVRFTGQIGPTPRAS